MSKNEINLKILEGITGSTMFKQILEAFPGERIYIPRRGEFSTKQERNNAIWNDFCQNMSITELANKYGLSVDSIYRIIDCRG